MGFQHDYSIDVEESVEIECKYSGYVRRQLELIEQIRKMEDLAIPNDFNYLAVRGLSGEEQEKLLKVRPLTVGQASRISGVNPSAIQALVIFLRSRTRDRVVHA